MSANGKSEDLTPKQIAFLAYYTDPKSETFSNAYRSALKAGYEQQYAENITNLMPDWLSEAMERRKRMLMKAEQRLEQSLGSDDEKLAQDTAKFIAKTLGKEQGYSDRVEHTGPDGKELQINIISFHDKIDNG
jgi:hypothetical protein